MQKYLFRWEKQQKGWAIKTISPRFLPARYLVIELKGCIETWAISVYVDSNQYILFSFHFSSLELLFGSEPCYFFATYV